MSMLICMPHPVARVQARHLDDAGAPGP